MSIQTPMFMETLGISIDPELLAKLEVFAKNDQCSVEEIIIRAVLDYSARSHNNYEK